MPKERIEGLISELHERLAESDTSIEQDRLLAQMQSELEGWEGAPQPNGDLRGTAEYPLEDIEEQHPNAARVLRDIIQTLHHAGL